MNSATLLRMERGRFRDLAALASVWVAMVLVANPIGDFPLNDDWTYGVSVKTLVEEGRFFFLTEWANKTLVAHIFWGALFCLPFGFSYTALRFSQLTAGLLGGFAVYWLCLELGASRRTSLICALTLLVNPLYFQLSNTFMTDVGFTAAATLAILILVKAMLQAKPVWSALGWILVGFSIWVRELTLLIPVGYFATQVYRFGGTARALARAALPLLAFFVLLWIHQNWLVDLWGFPNLDNSRSNSATTTIVEKPLKFAQKTAGGIAVLFMYVGFFALPILLLYRNSPPRHESKSERGQVLVAGSIVLVLSVATMVVMKRIMPLAKNTLFDLGLGPPTLRDIYLLKIENLPTAPAWLWTIITAAALWGAWEISRLCVRSFAYVWTWQSRLRNDSRRWLVFFFFAMCVVYSAVIIASRYFDRYLLIYLPLIAALLALLIHEPARPKRLVNVLVFGALAVFGLFAALATHDYLSWNRVRWEVVHDLKNVKAIPPSKIDGGYEVNGSLMFEHGLTKAKDKSWWWVDDDEYIIAFGPIRGYSEFSRTPFSNYLYGKEASICVLKRE